MDPSPADLTFPPTAPCGGTAIPIRFLLEYGLVRLFGAVVASLGPAGAAALARRAGDLLRAVDARHRRVAEENLRRALPDVPEAERTRILRDSYRGLVLGGVELFLLPRFLTPRSFRNHIEIVGVDRVREVVGDRGAVLVSGHVGNWEVLGATLGLIGVPLNSVAQPIKNPLLDRYLIEMRTRYGQRIVPKKGALRALVAVLREGGYLGLLVDQDARKHGIFVDYFGRAASTIPTPATLALRLGVPIVTGYCVRVDGAPFRFRVTSDPEPLEGDPDADRDEEIRRLTQEINVRLERFVREHPGQYLWQHRRWKTRPPEETAEGAAHD